MNPYITHQEYLKKELLSLRNSAVILELGVGNGSSPLMYDFCKKNPKSKVISFENDQVWFENIFNQYGELDNYIFNLIDEWSNLPKYLSEKSFDLVFVDQAPWEARIESIDFVKDKTKTFVVHDYDYYNGNYESTYINDENSWWAKTYGSEFNFEDNYEILPPTLIMRKK